jgi:DNA-binding response OmpR family regulator
MAKEKIFLIEDDKSLSRALRYNLEKAGYAVAACGDGGEAAAACRKEGPDLVILDLMLPGIDGLEVLRQVRQFSQVPVLILTAKKSELDKVVGFKVGADDYVGKPFSVAEVLARVEALLRRSKLSSSPPGGRAGLRRIGELELDVERHELRLKGEPIELTPREFEFLALLAEADGRLLSRDQILERVWGYDRSMEIDTRTVDQHIARLRRKLKGEGSRIVTVTNSGYKLRLD